MKRAPRIEIATVEEIPLHNSPTIVERCVCANITVEDADSIKEPFPLAYYWNVANSILWFTDARARVDAIEQYERVRAYALARA
eukprot:IDg6138t1